MAKEKFNPTPIRLGEFKAPLQTEAQNLDRSLNWLVVHAVKRLPCIEEYEKQKKNKKNSGK